MIDKSRLISPSDSEDIKLCLSKAWDLYTKAQNSGKAFYTKFLTPSDKAAIMGRFPDFEPRLASFGGYDDAERCLVCFYTYEDEIYYPISCLKLKCPSFKNKLSHRDYLGSLLSLGIKRETLGDIVLTEDGAYVFCLNEIAAFIEENLKKIGGVGVKISYGNLEDIQIVRSYDVKGVTVSSMRCDAVIASALNLSRSMAAELILGGMVTVNYETASSPDKALKDGDVISARGYGKFKLQTEGRLTKKGRIHIDVLKYM